MTEATEIEETGPLGAFSKFLAWREKQDNKKNQEEEKLMVKRDVLGRRQTKRVKKANKRNLYVCDCGVGLESKALSQVTRHNLTQAHLTWAENREIIITPEPVVVEESTIDRALYEWESPPIVVKPKVIKKARKDLFYCRECGKQRRVDPTTGMDFLGHPGPTGKVKLEVVPSTVVEVVEKTGLSTNSSDVLTALNQLEHEVRERIRSSEKILSHIDSMREVLG